MLSGGYREFTRCLDEQMGNNTIVGNQCEALGAQTHAKWGSVQFQTERLGECAIAVGQHGDAFGCGLAFCPGAHYEGIIHGQTGQRITLCSECFGILDKAGKMFRRTGRRESAGHGKHDDVFSGEEFRGFDGLDAVFEGVDGDIGNGVSDCDCHVQPVGIAVRE